MGDMKVCPDCAEDVLADAEVCRHCGHEWPGGERWRRRRNRRALVVLVVVALLGLALVAGLAQASDNSEKKACEDTQAFLDENDIDVETRDC